MESEIQQTRANPLSSKITNVLSASYTDFEVRDALETLDIRGIQNTSETRRNLRLDVQKEIIDCNGEIVHDFSKVAERLRDVGSALASLQKTCAEICKHVSAAKREAAPLVDETKTLMAQKEHVTTKQQLLRGFNAHYLLSDAELSSLTSGAEPLDDSFFSVLAKAKTIHADCQHLLSGGGDNQRLGLEILEQSSANLSAAFTKLHRWIQREFKTLDLENPRMSLAIRRALRVLAERPTLFQSCLDAFAEARERNLSDAFHAALTGSGDEGQKPIEFSAHEPLRYVADMLAWAHSTTVSEREALEGLFISEGDGMAQSIREGHESEPWSRPEDGEAFDGRKALGQLINRNLEGVAQVLRQRIDQVIHTHEEPVMEYKIANLVVFYRGIFRKLLESNGFLHMLDSLESTAITQFRTTMRYHVGNVQSENQAISGGFGAPSFLIDALEELHLLLKSYDTSAAMVDSDGEGLSLVLQEALDPFLDHCSRLATNMPEPSSYCFAINCLSAAKTTLSSFPFARQRIEPINNSIDSVAQKLETHQHTWLLQSSGLEPLLTAVSALSDSNPSILSALPIFTEEPLLTTSQHLDDFLPTALSDALHTISALQSSSLAHSITDNAIETFCSDFDALSEIIQRIDAFRAERANGTEQLPLRTLFPRTSDEIRILLS